MFKRIMCAIFGHPVDRNRVWFDGVDFRATCPRCRQKLIKNAKRAWIVVDADKIAADSNRMPHPRDRQ